MRVLLIGGYGYIGSSILKSLSCDSMYEHITVVDPGYFGDPKVPGYNIKYEPCTIHKFISTQCIDFYDIILFFSGHSSVSLCNTDPMGAIKNSGLVFYSLVEKIKNQKLVYASSSCVYGNACMASEDTPVRPVDGLSHTKAFMDHIALSSGKNIYGLRLGSVCGPSINFRNDLAINKMTTDALTEKVITVFNPFCERPFVSINDVVKSTLAIIRRSGPPGIYNVSNFNMSFNELANTISDITGARVENGSFSNTYDFTMNSDKIRETYCIPLDTKIEDIVKDIVASFPYHSVPRKGIIDLEI